MILVSARPDGSVVRLFSLFCALANTTSLTLFSFGKHTVNMKRHKRFSFALTKLPSSSSYVFVHNSFFFSKLFLAVAQVIPKKKTAIVHLV